MNQMPKTAFVISHSHWDRAWYLPFQICRLALVRLIDQLLDHLQDSVEFQSFMLDGQMLPIYDYLEIRPENREDLVQLVKEGRLTIGPWYCLADEYLVSPEALIRNLMYGLRLSEEYGGGSRLGYVPDSFGHINQLPQILQGFGIDSAVFWRGMGDEAEHLGDEFTWSAPQGSAVLAVHLRNGYFNLSNLGYPVRFGFPDPETFDPDLALSQLLETAGELLKTSKSNTVLLMNGIDHAHFDPRVPAILQQANAAQEDIIFLHSSLGEFLSEIRQHLPNDLPVFKGEFNRSRFAYGLQGVYSSRMYLQQANYLAQLSLEQYAEPLSTWSWINGAAYPGEFLQQAWKILLQNHPHDDICGCSSDPVHRENQVRFEQVQQITEPICEAALAAVAARIGEIDNQGPNFLIYNPLPHSRRETVEIDLYQPAETPLPDDFQLLDARGKPLPMQRLVEEEISLHRINQSRPYQHIRAAVALEDLPGCGYMTVRAASAEQHDPPLPPPVLNSTPSGMENQSLRVEINPDGTLNLEDKITGRQFNNLHHFQDQADVGDGYDFAPCPHAEVYTTREKTAEIKQLSKGPLQISYQIKHQFSLPEAINRDRSTCTETCELISVITLRKGARRLEIKTTFENRVRDHRLRVLFPTGVHAKQVHSEGHFWVNERPVNIPPGQDWDQPPVSTRHQRSFVDLSNGEWGLAVLNRGLPEYEILPSEGGGIIALTLLRCVGFLSRGDLPTRPGGHAGPPGVATPDAQCPGIQEFEYAIVPHAGDWRAMYPESARYQNPVITLKSNLESLPVPDADLNASPFIPRRREKKSLLPRQHSFLTLEPELLGLSIVKKAEDHDALIVRIFNPGPDEIKATLRAGFFIQTAQEAKLNEQPLRRLSLTDPQTITLPIAGGEIKTLALDVIREEDALWDISRGANP